MPDVVISNEGPVRRIRMNRPDKKNALTLAMYEAMAAAIEEAGTADGVRCILIAADNAVLMTPFVSLGLLPEAGSSLIAPRLMGHARAFSLLVMGKPLTAEEAMGAGIVNTVVPAAELDAHALNVARDVAALPPESVTA